MEIIDDKGIIPSEFQQNTDILPFKNKPQKSEKPIADDFSAKQELFK